MTFGMEVITTSRRGLYVSVTLAGAFSGYCGLMSDEDFLNQPIGDERTHLSLHNNSLKTAHEAEIRAGWTFAFPDLLGADRAVRLIPSAGIRYHYVKWLASDGYYQYEDMPGSQSAGDYTPWSENTTKVEVFGPVIGYSQEFIIPLLSVTAEAQLSARFSAQASLAFSPLVTALATDSHLLTGTEYLDSFEGLIFFRPSVQAEWRTASALRFFGEVDWQYIGGRPGDTYLRYPPSETLFGPTVDGAGLSYQALNVRLGMGLILEPDR